MAYDSKEARSGEMRESVSQMSTLEDADNCLNDLFDADKSMVGAHRSLMYLSRRVLVLCGFLIKKARESDEKFIRQAKRIQELENKITQMA